MNDRSLEPSRTWYVVRCKQYRERLASANLGAQGFEPYLPMLLTKRKRLGIWSSVAEPLFPGYLFLGVVSAKEDSPRHVLQDIHPVRSTREVLGMIRFGQSFAIVLCTEIAQLRAREAETNSGMVEDPRLKFARGDAVRIRSGRLSGLNGAFEQRLGHARVLVLLRYLDGYLRPVSMPVDQIEKA